MGNNRLQLKEKIAQDLREKIEDTKKILVSLEGALTDVHRNSAKVQSEVQTGFEELYQHLLARKSTLVAQIEELSKAQGATIQECIQQAYLDLGSLQSTLFHIDSFDLGQLSNVQQLNFDRMNIATIPPPVKTTLGTVDLKNEINKWGSTFVDFSNADRESGYLDLTKLKITSEADADVTKPKPPSTLNTVESPAPKEINALDFDVDHWLREIKSQTSNEAEDFEMLFMDLESCGNKVQGAEKLSSTAALSIELEVVDAVDLSKSNHQRSYAFRDSEDSSLDEDLSKWLKPKKPRIAHENSTDSDLSKWLKPKNTNDLSSISPLPALVPPEVLQPKMNSCSKVASSSPYLDFPCLRLDPKCWLHKKASKENLNFNLRTDFVLAPSENQIIPPTYALPYPFWLKKC